jgi:hypothetical protein
VKADLGSAWRLTVLCKKAAGLQAYREFLDWHYREVFWSRIMCESEGCSRV